MYTNLFPAVQADADGCSVTKEVTMEGLLWFLIFGGLFYVMMRYGCGAHMVHGYGLFVICRTGKLV